MNTYKRKLWLDCDPGNDDSMAIVLALFHPNCELLGLSTVFGNQGIDKVTKNAIRLLSITGQTTIPVFKGAAHSLQQFEAKSADIHGSEGLFGAERFSAQFEPTQAASLYSLIKQRAGDQQFTFVMTGAQTNGALLLREHPELLGQIDKVIFMGGAAGYGNITPNAEFNIYSDPLACQHVIDICKEANKELVMIGLDLSHQVLCTQEVLDRIEGIDTEFSDWCCEMLQEFRNGYKQQEFDSPPLHDPLTIYYALHPEDFETRLIAVDVETKYTSCYGRTVCDIKNRWSKDRHVTFCKTVKIDKFWDAMICAISMASSVALIK